MLPCLTRVICLLTPDKVENSMLKQKDMTDTAAAVLYFLPSDKWAGVDEVAVIAGITSARCQLILTQLAMAGLVKDNRGSGKQFKRCQ